jgi:hypothetical protein
LFWHLLFKKEAKMSAKGRKWPLDTITAKIKVTGSNKDYPPKDFGKKKGWHWSILLDSKTGRIIHCQKSYCKTCKEKFWYTVPSEQRLKVRT